VTAEQAGRAGGSPHGRRPAAKIRPVGGVGELGVLPSDVRHQRRGPEALRPRSPLHPGAGCEERQAVAEAGLPDLGSYRPRLTMTPGGAAALPRHCETG
jgi:hypothetical protein